MSSEEKKHLSSQYKAKNKYLMESQYIQLITGGYVKLQYDVDNTGARVLAYVIDNFFMTVLYYIAYTIVDKAPWDRGVDGFLYFVFFIVALVLVFFNMAFELLFSGQTIGKMVMKIKVINSDCLPPTFLQSFYRWIMVPIDFFVGLFFIARSNQRLGDILSGCYVVGCRSGKQDKVNIANEFAYLSPTYKVHYPAAEKLTGEQVLAIQKVLHNYVYKSSHKLIERKVKEKLNLTKTEVSGRAFLQTVMNDYKYIEMTNKKQYSNGDI